MIDIGGQVAFCKCVKILKNKILKIYVKLFIVKPVGTEFKLTFSMCF